MDTPAERPMAGPTGAAPASTGANRERIVDVALALAQQRGWEAVRLRDVADEAGMTMADLHACFREKEDIVEAFFDRADRALIAAADTPDFEALSSRERVHRLIMAWLHALAPHRRTVRQMIANKLEPGHLHVQIPGLLRISRTVQWVREASGRDATFLRRALEETVLTSIYVSTFVYWMRDDSPDSERTERLLARTLARGERLENLLSPRRRRDAVDDEPIADIPAPNGLENPPGAGHL